MKDELSFSDIRDLLNQAINKNCGPDDYCWIRDVYTSAVVYDNGNGQLYKRSYVIDDKNVVTLGDPQQVVEVTEYEPVEMAAFDLEGEFSEDEELITVKGKIFEVGDYPDKQFSLTAEEMAAAVASFKPVPVDLAHTSTPLDGKLGELKAVEVAGDGKTLFGEVALPKWLDKALGDVPRKVSCTWNRATKQLEKLALVNNPRISDAVLVAAYSEFEESKRTHTDTGAAADNNPNPTFKETPKMSDTTVNNSAEFDALKAQFEAQKAEIERLKAVNRHAQAEAFAEAEIVANRALPAERQSIVAAFEQALADDEASPVEVQFAADSKGGRAAMLRAMYAARPAHNLTKETVAEGQILFSQSPKEKEQADKDAEEVNQMLGYTKLGQKALAAKQASSK